VIDLAAPDSEAPRASRTTSGWSGLLEWKDCLFWLSWAAIGQVAALHLIDAGPQLHYQHYRPLASLLAEPQPLLALLIAQTVLVAAALWRRRASWTKRLTYLRPPRLVLATLLFVLPSAALSRDPASYLPELCFAALLQAVNLGTIVLAVFAMPEAALIGLKQRTDLLLRRPADSNRSDGPVRGNRLALVGALWVALLAGALAWFVYERHPHIPDEVVYLYQARTLAAGSLSLPAPPVPEAFSIYMMPTAAERWYSPFPPGWPALLAGGTLVGLPWIVNPFLAAVGVLLTYFLVSELHSRRLALLVVLLLCASPWYVFMAMSFMSHVATLVLALAAALAMLRARRGCRASWGLAAGLLTGLLSLVRPLDAVAIGVLLGLWPLTAGLRAGLPILLAFGLGALAAGSLALPYNAQLTGNPWLPPLEAHYEEYYGPRSNALGFGPERGLGWAIDAFPGHSPAEAALNALLNAFSVNVELFGWSCGSLLLIIFLVSHGGVCRADYPMLAVIAAIAGLYSLYWFGGGPDFGARYWFLMVVPLTILTARGVARLAAPASGEGNDRRLGQARVLAGVGLLCALSLLIYFPWRATDKYHGYLGMRPAVADLARQRNMRNGLVFVRGQEHPDYQSAWTYNSLHLDAGEPVFVRYLSADSFTRVRQAFPDRPVWVVDGPSLTGGTYEVVESAPAEGTASDADPAARP
jgi:hypothetical protein